MNAESTVTDDDRCLCVVFPSYFQGFIRNNSGELCFMSDFNLSDRRMGYGVGKTENMMPNMGVVFPVPSGEGRSHSPCHSKFAESIPAVQDASEFGSGR